MKFSYAKFALQQRSPLFGFSVLRPIIPLTIQAGDHMLKYQALVDSGADFSIFDAEVGEELGLNIRSGDEMRFGGVQGYGGAVAYLHAVTLILGGKSFQTIVGFSYDIGKRGTGILGQKGFFDRFAVKFELMKESIELSEKK